MVYNKNKGEWLKICEKSKAYGEDFPILEMPYWNAGILNTSIILKSYHRSSV